LISGGLMDLSRGTGIIAFLMILSLLLVSSVQIVSALSIHYELDKSYYHPGDSGRLLLLCNNDGPGDLVISNVKMDIVGIGTFESDMTGLTAATNLPPGVSGYVLKTRQTATIEVYFKVPVDTKPGEYKYTWIIDSTSGNLMTRTETFRVYPVGEKPPPEPPNPFLLGLVALPILVVAYPFVRWKNKRIAKIVAIGIAALLVLDFVLGGFLFVSLVLTFIAGFYPLLILLILCMVAASMLRRKRKKEDTRDESQLLFPCHLHAHDTSETHQLHQEM